MLVVLPGGNGFSGGYGNSMMSSSACSYDAVSVGLSICFLLVSERILIEKKLTGMKRGYIR